MGSYTVGNITGTYDIANDRLTNVNCSGQIGSAVSNVTLTHPTSGYYNCDGTTSDLRNMFLRKYRSSGASSWSSDTSNEDRIVSNSLNSLAGTSLSVRPCGNSFDGYGFVLKTDFSSAMTYTDVHFWVYNPCDYDIQFRLYVYKGTGCTTAEQVGLSATKDIAKAHSWVYIARGMGSKTFYNFILSVWTADQTSSSTTMAAKLLFDDVYFS